MLLYTAYLKHRGIITGETGQSACEMRPSSKLEGAKVGLGQVSSRFLVQPAMELVLLQPDHGESLRHGFQCGTCMRLNQSV